ncbi:hypothetical protein [Pacificoceanicola onchidii]|uniref:hypothetical protein n=1 Tax=Pacificoceanicola onchidii TaxID=2562685 RepID=UPI0010A69DF1|nr:hypothetical protein [Pacificoceanicola onchidii]
MSSHPDPQFRKPAVPAFVWAGLVVAVFLMALPIVDFMMFSVAGKKFGRPTSFMAYVEYRLDIDIPGVGAEQVAQTAEPEFSDKPLGAMTIEEKRAFAKHLDDVLPASHDGWTRRSYEKADYYRLNPDLARCMDHKIPACPSGTSGSYVTVYEKGDKLIAVRLQFQRDRDFRKPGVYIPPGKIKSRGKRRGMISHMFGGVGNGSYWDYKYYKPFMRRGQFNFVQRERQNADYTGVLINYPYRIFMRQRHDGVFDAFIVSNAEGYEVKRFIQKWDWEQISAMIAPVASGLRSGSQIEAETGGSAHTSVWRKPAPASSATHQDSGNDNCPKLSSDEYREQAEQLQRLLREQRQMGEHGGRVVRRNCQYVVVRN